MFTSFICHLHVKCTSGMSHSQELNEMLPALVLSIAIRAEFFGDPLRNKERKNGSNTSISVLSSTE